MNMNEWKQSIRFDGKFYYYNKTREIHKYSEETRKKRSKSLSGENHPFYGRHHTEEAKKKICESCKAAWTDDKRHNQSIKMSSIAKINQSKRSILYNEYKTKGGSMKWNQFQSNLQSLIIEYNLGDNIND